MRARSWTHGQMFLFPVVISSAAHYLKYRNRKLLPGSKLQLPQLAGLDADT